MTKVDQGLIQVKEKHFFIFFWFDPCCDGALFLCFEVRADLLDHRGFIELMFWIAEILLSHCYISFKVDTLLLLFFRIEEANQRHHLFEVFHAFLDDFQIIIIRWEKFQILTQAYKIV